MKKKFLYLLNHKSVIIITWFFLFIYPVFFLCNGVDVTDTGFWLTSYQSFFKDPQSIQFLMSMWLTLFLGGIIDLCFSYLGVIAYKLFYLIILNLTIFISYKTLSLCFKKIHPIFFLPVVFTINYTGTNYAHYYTFSMLFYTLSLFLLSCGLKFKNSFLYFGSGFFFAINIFIKPPNVLGFIFFFLLIFAILYFRQKEISYKNIIYAFLGSKIGFILIVSLIVYFNHLDYYINSLFRMQEVANSMSVMTYFSYYKYIFLFFILFFILFKFIKRQNCISFFSILFLIFILFYIYFNNFNPQKVISILVGLCIAIYLILLFEKKSFNLFIILASSFFLLIVSPLGSNTGVIKSCYSFAINLPLCLLLVTNNKSFNKKIATIIVFIISFCSFKGIVHNIFPYRDSTTTVFDYHSELNCSKSKFIYSSKSRTYLVEEVIKFLKSYVDAGDRILAYEKVALLYYLSDTHPWFGHPWPLELSCSEILSQLDNCNNSRFPVVVRASFSTSNKMWPIYNESLLDKYKIKRNIIQSFLDNNSYKLIWKNDFFEVLDINRKI